MEDFSWEGGDSLTQNRYRPSLDKKQRCKGEPYRLNEKQDLSIQTYRQTHILLLLFMDNFSLMSSSCVFRQLINPEHP